MRSWMSWMRSCGRRARAPEISAADLARWLAAGQAVQVIDIRDAAAFCAGHLPGAQHLPMDRLEQSLGLLDPGRLTVVY
jgi:rhodanese-related sulfurtransferase